MSEQMIQQSPLVEVAVDQAIVSMPVIEIVEQPFNGQYILRGRADDAAFNNALKTILNVELPTKANTVVAQPGLSVFWMSPDQWLLLVEDNAINTKLTMLAGALQSEFALLTDVSSGQTLIKLSGEKAEEVMNKGTTFDVHPLVFNEGQCAQTVFAKSNVLIYPQKGQGRLDYYLIVRRSFADFLARWLKNACVEYKG